MSRTITIRRTVTGPTNTFSSEFTIAAAAELVLEETIPDTATSAESGAMDIELRIPNQDTGDQVKAFLLEATGQVDSVEFFDSSGIQIGTVSLSLSGSGQAYFFPTEDSQAPPSPFEQDTDIAKIKVLRPDGVSGDITLHAYVLYDPTP